MPYLNLLFCGVFAIMLLDECECTSATTSIEACPINLFGQRPRKGFLVYIL